MARGRRDGPGATAGRFDTCGRLRSPAGGGCSPGRRRGRWGRSRRLPRTFGPDPPLHAEGGQQPASAQLAPAVTPERRLEGSAEVGRVVGLLLGRPAGTETDETVSPPDQLEGADGRVGGQVDVPGAGHAACLVAPQWPDRQWRTAGPSSATYSRKAASRASRRAGS